MKGNQYFVAAFVRELKIRNYSPRTVKAYFGAIRQFESFARGRFLFLDEDLIKNFLYRNRFINPITDVAPIVNRTAAIIVPIITKLNAFQYSTPNMKETTEPVTGPLPGKGSATRNIMKIGPYFWNFLLCVFVFYPRIFLKNRLIFLNVFYKKSIPVLSRLLLGRRVSMFLLWQIIKCWKSTSRIQFPMEWQVLYPRKGSLM
jgi:hypothetical protein